MQHAVTPFCKGHPRWVVLSGGWGLIPLIPIGWLQWGLGVPRSRRGGGLQGCLCKQTTGGSSSIPGIGTDPAGGPTTPPPREGSGGGSSFPPHPGAPWPSVLAVVVWFLPTEALLVRISMVSRAGGGGAKGGGGAGEGSGSAGGGTQSGPWLLSSPPRSFPSQTAPLPREAMRTQELLCFPPPRGRNYFMCPPPPSFPHPKKAVLVSLGAGQRVPTARSTHQHPEVRRGAPRAASCHALRVL